jgi:hypothetical protein
MLVYDLNKSQVGLNPLKCFRLSKVAIDALCLDDLLQLTDDLVQDKIQASKLNIQNFFEEVTLQVNRSHLLQAFLFDHVLPHMPAFNTNVLKLGSNTQHMAQMLYQATETSQALVEEVTKVEAQHKQTIKTAKKNLKKVQAHLQTLRDKPVKSNIDEKEEKEAIEKLKVSDSVESKRDLMLLSR